MAWDAPYYGETREDYINRRIYEFANREPENTTYPGTALTFRLEPTPNTYVEYYDGIPVYCQNKIVQIDIKKPEASFLAAERLVAPFELSIVDWTGYYHGIGWKHMAAYREHGNGKIIVQEVGR